MTDARDECVHTPTGKIFVRRWVGRDRTAAPLILLHDSLGCVDLWGSFPAALVDATGRDVIAYDRLGYGRSADRRSPLASNFIADEVEQTFAALLTHLNLDTFCVMGHSVGGGMAFTVAARYSDRCIAAIIESAQAIIEERTLTGIRDARRMFEDEATLQRLSAVHGGRAKFIIDAWAEAWLALEPLGWDLTHDLPKLNVPTLIIHGDDDEFGSLENPRRIAAHCASAAQVQIIRECGHIPHREHRDQVLRMIQVFVKNLN